jgi:hypothetical protein
MELERAVFEGMQYYYTERNRTGPAAATATPVTTTARASSGAKVHGSSEKNESNAGDPPMYMYVHLSRSTWAGGQRYGGAVWSGDTESTFEDLNNQFRAGLNVLLSGVTYWTSDIG